jgi:UPF0042 nucleotide-binding protein
MPDRTAKDTAAPHKANARTRVLLVTGMSGAGKSTALKVFEDLGYEAVDNIPLSLLKILLAPAGDGAAPRHGAVAATIDIRTRDFTVDAFLADLEPLMSRGDLDISLLFFDCEDGALGRRYAVTRRRHPLAEDRPLMDGIRHEREIIAPLRDHSDVVFDTSSSNIAELRRTLNEQFKLDAGPGLTVSVTSFSYRRGLPRQADIVFDVRFLANPHYDEDLRQRTGRDPGVAAYIANDPAFTPFFESLSALLLSLLPHYDREGKTYLTIAVGCTGGRHRSVFVAERLAVLLRDNGQPVTLRHRDIDGRAA